MKNLYLAIILLAMSISSYASNWNYEYLENDFGEDTKLASIKDDNDLYELVVTLDRAVALLLPTGKVTSPECSKVCKAKINVDGNKNLEPIKLLESRDFRTYFIYGESKDRFIGYLESGKDVKIQIPLHRNLAVLSFTPDSKLNLDKLNNLQSPSPKL